MRARRSVRLLIRVAVVGAAAGMGFLACAPGVVDSQPTANVRAFPSISVIPTVTLNMDPPILSVTPTRLDFGNVPVGTSKSLNAVLTNSGSMASAWDRSGGDPTSSDFTFTWLNCHVGKYFPYGAVCQLTFTFTPSSTGVV